MRLVPAITATLWICGAGLPNSLVQAADSPLLYGIHWWGYTQGQGIDNVPCQLLDCGTYGGWDLETILTHSDFWWGANYFVPLYADLATNKKMTIITRIDYKWSSTVPWPGSPDYATWPASCVNVVNTLKNYSHIWVIGNEPNFLVPDSGWPNGKIDPVVFAQIYRNVRNAIRTQAQASPLGEHIVLVGPAGPGPMIPGVFWMSGLDWWNAVLSNIPANEIDGLALHAYGWNVTEFHNTYAEQLNFFDSKGLQSKPVYLTEWNRYTNPNVNPGGEEATTAQMCAQSFADVNAWNQTPGKHNIVSMCWFVYDADQQAGNLWNGWSIEYWRGAGNPLGSGNDLYTAFEQAVDQRYPAGKIGTPGLGQIVRSPASFTRTVYKGDNLPNDTFTIRNGITGTMTYSLTDDASWLSLSPTSGSSSGETDTITIIYSVSALEISAYQATITITGSASNSPQTISVNLQVQPSPYAPVDFDRDGDVDQEDFGRFQVCFTGSGVPQTNTACANARLDADSDVDLDDFGIFQLCMTRPNVQANPNCAQ